MSKFTRREFLKTGGLALAGLTIAPSSILGKSHGHVPFTFYAFLISACFHSITNYPIFAKNTYINIANIMKKLYPTSTTTATMTISPSTLNHVIQLTPIIL